MNPRVRNGISLERLQRLHEEAPGRALPPGIAFIRTEWGGGVQSVASVPMEPDDDGPDTRVLISCDEPAARCGNGSAPTSLELAAAAISAGFLQGFVIEATVRDVAIDALVVDVVVRESSPRATALGPVCTIACTVDSPAASEELQAIARRALTVAPVVGLLRDPPEAVVWQAAGRRPEREAAAGEPKSHPESSPA